MARGDGPGPVRRLREAKTLFPLGKNNFFLDGGQYGLSKKPDGFKKDIKSLKLKGFKEVNCGKSKNLGSRTF